MEKAKDLVKIDKKENEKKAFDGMSGNKKDGEIENTDEEMSNETNKFTVKFTHEEKEKTVEKEWKNSLEIENTDEEMSNETNKFTLKFTHEEKEKTVEKEWKNSLDLKAKVGEDFTKIEIKSPVEGKLKTLMRKCQMKQTSLL